MSITSIATLTDALSSNSVRIPIDKASTSMGAATLASLWRLGLVPAAGTLPTIAVLCNNTTAGALPVPAAIAGQRQYIARLLLSCNITPNQIEVRDRIAHMGGLSGTVTTDQAVGLSIPTLAPAAERLGSDSDYSDLQWYFEWYGTTGAIATNATVTVTYNDGTTGNIVVTWPASRLIYSMLPIVPVVPGKFIRSIETVTLSVTTGGDGNFGVTVTRLRTTFMVAVANVTEELEWAELGFPDIEPTSCLMLTAQNNGTSTGTVRGFVRIVNG